MTDVLSAAFAIRYSPVPFADQGVIYLMSAYLHGLLNLSFWGHVAALFAMIQISMMAVTLYLHRDQAHRAIDLHPALRHFFRLWIWLTSAMVTREWVAVHRKHHALCEREGDPHSPVVFGLRKVLLQGAELYRAETSSKQTVDKYGRGCPDDWLEKNLYERFSPLGPTVMAIVDLLLFGVGGITIWALQMLTMPVFAAGVINGLGHARGYRNFQSDDTSTNLYPFAVLIGGEELHNNHHAFPTSAKFSMRPWEFDIGWFYITWLKRLGLCKVRRVAPQPHFADSPRVVDINTVRAVLQNRMHVLRDYSRQVMLPVLRMELRGAGRRRLLRRARSLLLRKPQFLDEPARARLSSLLEQSVALRTVHEYREQLAKLWEQANVSNDKLVSQLREWCAQAEASGVRALQEFSASLRGYLPQPA